MRSKSISRARSRSVSVGATSQLAPERLRITKRCPCRPVAAGIAWQTQDEGLWGTLGIKGLYRLAQSGEGRLDDLGLLYVERIPYDSRVYFGYGAGLWAWRLDDRREVNFGILRGYGVGAEALAGYQFDPPTDDLRLAIETSLVLVTPMHSFTSSALILAVVAGF